MADQYSDQFSSPEAVRLARQMAARRANNAPSSSSPKYELGYDSDGNTVLVPSSPAAEPARRNRIMEGISEGFGEQPLAGVSEEDRRNYPTLSRFLDPAQKAMNAVVRAPGAIAGGASGAFGAGVEALTDDRGNANYQQRQMKSLLDYIGLSEAAGAGGPKGAAPTPEVNPVTQYRKAYESTPSEGPIGVVQSPVGSARRPEMGGQRYSQDVARQARIDEIIKQAANDTAQTRQTSAVQEAIDAAARRAREGMPREMTADEIAAMRQSFAEANPEPASPMSLPVATGTVLAGSLASRNRPSQPVARADVDEGHLDPQLFGVQRPTAGMDRTNTLGVDELSAYPSGAVHNYNRSNSLGVDELSAYPAGAVHNYNRSNAPGVDETSAYRRGPVQAAKQQVASKMPETIDLNTKGAATQPQSSTGFFSNFGNRPLTTRQAYQQSVDNPDDAGAWMRAERQYAATHKDNPNFDVTKLDDSGMNRGGSVGGKLDKDAALHKALEIIHHMLRSR